MSDHAKIDKKKDLKKELKMFDEKFSKDTGRVPISPVHVVRDHGTGKKFRRVCVR